jgi:hypothetical protein
VICFDYTKQEWLDGEAGDRVRLTQLEQEHALLFGPDGAKYHEFTKSELSREEALCVVLEEMSTIMLRLNTPASPRGWDSV